MSGTDNASVTTGGMTDIESTQQATTTNAAKNEGHDYTEPPTPEATGKTAKAGDTGNKQKTTTKTGKNEGLDDTVREYPIIEGDAQERRADIEESMKALIQRFQQMILSVEPPAANGNRRRGRQSSSVEVKEVIFL
jgi:hypothetical protein